MVAPTMGILLMFALNSVGGHSICPRPDVELLYPLYHQIFTRFFFDCAGAKKKLSKRNAKGKTRKKGAF